MKKTKGGLKKRPDGKYDTGRPAFYKTPVEMQKKIDEYFEIHTDRPMIDEDGHAITTKTGDPVYEMNPPTVSGLALHLGFCERQALYAYRDRNKDFFYTIKSAISKIADYAEQHLYKGKPTGAIFWLKNHGWVDRFENEVSGLKIVVDNKEDAERIESI